VGVKKLEWQEPSKATNGCWTAKCAFGTYSAVNDGGWYVMLDDHPRGDGFEWISSDLSKDTLETAKAAAQADYEARILSAIETVIPVSQPSCAKIEAARKAVEELANVQMNLSLSDWSRLSSVILSALEPSAARKLTLGEAATVLEREADELDGLVDSVSHHLRSKAKTIRALSSPDHVADAGKVEGDGWLPIEGAPKDGTEVLGFDALTKIMHVTFCNQGYWHDPDSHYYSEAQNFNPTHWLPLPSAPSQEVAGS